ncbi:acyl-CoA-binding domain-containing protein 6-like [Orbicella faveolata]|uniref:acyl-CoA-binding domain-containing protein 6-like n=1 Tax=Orbicella faveolata TaxID=48498 RepID=UPI0009E58BE8|nr:acyl-CoA-binding domain-containing protein 6-like [Orbicella faveolata]XP_020619016.1 acyl-CoA-binding domain-containing protein 6-like [Orbicella faveolata]
MAEYFDEVVLDTEDLEKLFQAATEFVRTMRNLSDEKKLAFYALYKQAKEGPCNTSRPGFWDIVGRAKWDSWKKLGEMSKQKALELYIQKLFETDPEWEAKYAVTDDLTVKESEKPAHKQTMGLAVSTLRGDDDDDDIISDTNKSVFDWCKEGNAKKMDALLTRENINSKDEQGLTLLHWACDRGHENVVTHLIKNKAGVNTQDADGQTPLHYAATCDFLSIVKELLQSGADCSIADNDGFRPADVADSSAIKELLNT